MICGCGASGFKQVADLQKHWKANGCQRGRPIWARVARAKKNGTSGKRILHRAFPDLYHVRPMPEHVVQGFREKT